LVSFLHSLRVLQNSEGNADVVKKQRQHVFNSLRQVVRSAISDLRGLDAKIVSQVEMEFGVGSVDETDKEDLATSNSIDSFQGNVLI